MPERMPTRNIKLSLYASLLILIFRIIFDLQHIQGDRYSFLDEVKVNIQYKDLGKHTNYSVWRSPLDNKAVELSDKRVDSIGKTITYLSIPRITFIKSIHIKTTDSTGNNIKGVSIRVGQRTVFYSQQQILASWFKESLLLSGGVKWTLPAATFSEPSHLPLLRSVINWRGDTILLGYLIRHNLSFLLLIGLFVFFSSYPYYFDWLVQKRPGWVLPTIFFAVIGFLKNTFVIWSLEANLDPSFVAGLAWAKNMGLQWGRDFTFTYGPYFWLTLSSIVLNSKQLFYAFTLNFLLTSLSLYILYSFAQERYFNKNIDRTIFLMILLSLLLFHFDFLDYLVIVVLILSYQNITDSLSKKPSVKLFCFQFIFVLLALLSLIKFSYVAFSLCILIVITVVYAYRKYTKDLIMTWISYSVWFIFLWIISGQDVQHIPSYLVNGYEIASGYTEAMAKPLWNDLLGIFINLISVFLFIIALVAIGLLFIHIVLNYTRPNLILFSFLTMPMVFLAFKEGFVRFDAPHMALFYSQILLLAIVFLLVAAHNRIPIYSFSNKFLLGTISLGFCLAPTAQFTNLKDARLVFNTNEKKALLDKQKKAIIQDIDIAKPHRDILRKAQKVDVIPVNISLLYAIDAKWNPRPVMQSYSVYTPKLSQQNGSYYRNNDSPDYILMNYSSIDNRYPIFDEPDLIQSLLTHYTPYANYANSYLLFERKPIPSVPHKRVVHSFRSSIGVSFPVYRDKGQRTFMSARVELTILGKLMNLFYKIPPLTMTSITYQDTIRHRIVRRTLTEEVLVSPYIASLKDIEYLFNKRSESSSNVSRISFNGNTLFYQKHIDVSFIVW